MAPRYLESEYYTRNALLIYTDDEPRFYHDARLLYKALTQLGMSVYTGKLATDGKGQTSLADFPVWAKEHDGKGNQLVLAYCGHGGVKHGRLMIAGGNDLTSLQEYLRDHCEADALTILHTCYAGTALGVSRSNNLFRNERVVEALAICNGRTIGRGHDNTSRWLERLTRIMACIEPGDAMSVKQISSVLRRRRRVGKMDFLGNQGFYRRESGRGSMQMMNISG
ncbi:hypothetical protein LTR97_000655 [Elasticomyces elasticus]|uniref:Uncharacterized protein n=1 Tax=Elasticomyces elasticus TaxID=574655 RepID=A0AAN7WJX8_9PEZI|nr:hypothetical protein LTR97_000655 [Elasticomyces elasticus]